MLTVVRNAARAVIVSLSVLSCLTACFAPVISLAEVTAPDLPCEGDNLTVLWRTTDSATVFVRTNDGDILHESSDANGTAVVGPIYRSMLPINLYAVNEHGDDDREFRKNLTPFDDWTEADSIVLLSAEPIIHMRASVAEDVTEELRPTGETETVNGQEVEVNDIYWIFDTLRWEAPEGAFNVIARFVSFRNDLDSTVRFWGPGVSGSVTVAPNQTVEFSSPQAVTGTWHAEFPEPIEFWLGQQLGDNKDYRDIPPGNFPTAQCGFGAICED